MLSVISISADQDEHFLRRNCVGMHLANATLWIMVASLLAAFEIKPAKDAQSVDIPIQVEYSDGLIRYAVGIDSLR